jgi:hypothetical protein
MYLNVKLVLEVSSKRGRKFHFEPGSSYRRVYHGKSIIEREEVVDRICSMHIASRVPASAGPGKVCYNRVKKFWKTTILISVFSKETSIS